MYFTNNKEYKCSIATTLSIKKVTIIWYLLDNKIFKDLNEDIEKITKKTLILKIKKIEENIITREFFQKIVYFLTQKRKQFKSTLIEMYKWGIKYIENYNKLAKKNNSLAKFKITR